MVITESKVTNKAINIKNILMVFFPKHQKLSKDIKFENDYMKLYQKLNICLICIKYAGKNAIDE